VAHHPSFRLEVVPDSLGPFYFMNWATAYHHRIIGPSTAQFVHSPFIVGTMCNWARMSLKCGHSRFPNKAQAIPGSPLPQLQQRQPDPYPNRPTSKKNVRIALQCLQYALIVRFICASRPSPGRLHRRPRPLVFCPHLGTLGRSHVPGSGPIQPQARPQIAHCQVTRAWSDPRCD